MEECFCGERASYFCRPCLTTFCKEHKIIHKNTNQEGHIFEKLGKRLTTQQFEKIIKNLSLKIKTADECTNYILKESKRLLVNITNNCMQAINRIKEKQQHYATLLGLCQKRLLADQIQKIQRQSRTSLAINLPPLKLKLKERNR